MKSSSANGVIHGYSERGVVNALFESLVAANDKALFQEFMDLMVHWKDGSKRDSVPGFDAYEVYIEPSLSDFGEPDVLVFLKEKDKDVEVYFIEAKVEPFLRSSPLIGKEEANEENDREKKVPGAFYQRNASSLLHELFLKVNFVVALSAPEQWPPSNLVDGVRNVYALDAKEFRKIGKDPLVLKLARRLHRFVGSGGEPYYVSLTTDSDTRRSDDVITLVGNIESLNVSSNQVAFTEMFSEESIAAVVAGYLRFCRPTQGPG